MHGCHAPSSQNQEVGCFRRRNTLGRNLQMKRQTERITISTGRDLAWRGSNLAKASPRFLYVSTFSCPPPVFVCTTRSTPHHIMSASGLGDRVAISAVTLPQLFGHVCRAGR